MAADAGLTFAGRPLLFAFEEGRLGFSCEGCAAVCCREAGGLWISARQSGLIDDLGCGHLVTDHRDGAVDFHLGLGGCPAQLPDGRCSFHVRGGLRAKPALCALFPFSVLTDAGSFLVVSPNLAFVCPLVLDPPPGATSPSHAEILDDLRFFLGDEAGAFHRVKAPTRGATTLERETRVLERTGVLRGRAPVLDALAEASGADDLPARLERALGFLGEEPLPDDPATCRDVLPLVPTLRVPFYSLPAPDIDVAILVAWDIARRALAAGGEPSVRRTASLFAAARRVAGLAARAHRPVRLAAGLKIEEGTAPETAFEVMLVLRDIRKRPGEEPLDGIVARHVRATGWRRTAVLMALRGSELVFE